MFGLIECWLFNKLGINCNLKKLEENNVFRDGCLLMNIFQKYGIVTADFCDNIYPATKKEDCIKNLKLLKPLFSMLKIKYNDTIINGITENKAGSIINLLFEVYICLENKQHLYFITQQNFEKICQDTVRNLGSVTVSEDTEKPVNNLSSSIACLEQPLINNADVTNWYKNKYLRVQSTLNAKISHLKSPVTKEISVKSSSKHCVIKNKSTDSSLIEDLPDINLFLKSSGEENLLDYDTFIARYKSKQNYKIEKKYFENSIQHELLNNTWAKIEKREDEVYNTVFSSVLLKQSKYEKQILSKLLQAEKETHIQNESRIWAKKSILNEEENIINSDFDFITRFENLQEIYNNEQRRVLELHKKLYKEKKEIIQRENLQICQDIVDALLELVTCTADYKSCNGAEVSDCLWNNWMQLFIKSQPIRLQLEPLEDSAHGDIDYDLAISFEKEQDEVLNESDIDEYLLTNGRWFFSSVCLEYADFNEANLAFIVYRLLSMKYPLPPSPPAADLPSFKTSGVLLNLHSTDFIEKLKMLLSKPGIHIFDTDMAVKTGLKRFTTETTPPPQEKGKNKKKENAKQQGGKNKKESKKKSSKTAGKNKSNTNGKIEPISKTNEGEKIISVVEKATQTSVTVIETGEDVNNRSPLGLLGEEVNNLLKEGKPLDDSLLVSVIIEYLKSIEDCDGWLLLNYPTTIGQAFHLELALTGKKLPLENFVSEENELGLLQIDVLDEWSEKRKSRLLNYPMSETETQSFKSYFSVFIKIIDEDKEIAATGNNLPEDNDQLSYSGKSIEIKDEIKPVPDFLKEFYCNQAILKEIYNSPSDMNSLKSLARIILGEDGPEAKTSVDLFGDEILNKITKGKKTDKNIKKSSNKQKGKAKLNPKKEDKINYNSKDQSETNKDNIDHKVDIFEETNPDKNLSADNLNELQLQEMEQNDKNRSFVCLPLNNEFSILLATMWENIESCYINNLKDIFFENRFINLRLNPYFVYVNKEIQRVINKPDLKQSIISIFQEEYNNVSNELRSLPEMKNQLHCRVFELQQNLWEIADERKNEVEAKRQDIIYENWLLSEICMLINNYLSFFQIEYERSVQTLQLVNDYYINMLDKIPPAIQPEIWHVEKMSVAMLLNTVQKINGGIEAIEDNGEELKEELKRNNFIAQSLMGCSEEEKSLYIFETLLLEKIKEVKTQFVTILEIFNNQNKVEANFINNANKENLKGKPAKIKEVPVKEVKKHKKESGESKSSVQLQEKPQEEKVEILVKKTLIEEWQSTINTENERLNFRLDLIHQRAKENIFEFFCFLETLFCNIRESILSSYDIDISNINSICDYLKTAIEEESSLQHPLILGQDNFFVGIKGDLNDSEPFTLTELKEDLHDCIFTIRQLSFLMEIFKISGPMGVIRKQPLSYILHDLMLLETSDKEPYLPKTWSFLNEVQLRHVLDEIFGIEFGVDWRDFIIYNLDIPFPEVKDLLHLRKQFLACDSEETELILQEDFENITLWFENELPSSPKQGLRFALVKKLLSDLFKVDSEHINYTALLLYFCKDFDPVFGFKKALSFSLGKNVVVTKSELETILQNEEEISEIVDSVLKDIINGIVMIRETAQIYEILEPSQSNMSNNGSGEGSMKSSLFASYKSLRSAKSLDIGISTMIHSSPPSLTSVNETPQKLLSPANVEKSWVTRIPVSMVLVVLNASFFYQDRRYALKNHYLNCLEEEADEDGMIEAYELVNLNCIKKLFTMTNKFKIAIPCEVLSACLQEDYKSQHSSYLRLNPNTI